MRAKRLIVGLTGSFGSGKSTVAKILKRLGARKVIDCDRLAHEVFRPGHPVGRKIKSLFNMKNRLDRRQLAETVFSDESKRRKLEALIHPYVYQRIDSELKNVKEGIVILEVPLLFETGYDRFCDATVAVAAGTRNIKKRLRSAGFTESQIRARLQAQLPELQKKKRADLLISNSGSKEKLMQKTASVWNTLTAVLNDRSSS